MPPSCTSSATASRLVMADIKQRLVKLGMMDLDEEQPLPLRRPSQSEPTPQMTGNGGSSGKREVPTSISAPASPSTTGNASPLDSPEAIRAKILQALNSPSRADAVVPAAGTPGALKAVFIKSTSDDISSKLSIIEEDPTKSGPSAIQKSVALGEEALRITVAGEDKADATMTSLPTPTTANHLPSSSSPISTIESVLLPAPSPPPIKSPQGVRRLQSWLSYFYSSTTAAKASAATAAEEGSTRIAVPASSTPTPTALDHQPSPALHPPPSPDAPEEAVGSIDPVLEEIRQMLARQPSKGILKMPKELSDMLDLPPPIQKSVFLRQEEVLRLSQFAERYRADSLPGEGGDSNSNSSSTYMSIDEEGRCTVHMRRRSGPLRRRRLKFDMERVRHHVTYGRGEYERGGVEYIAKSLTPEIAMMIKRELNEVKREMLVHEESRHYTQFYQLR